MPDIWRDRAEHLRPYSGPAAEAWIAAAEELQHVISSWATEPLSVQKAALESGYSEDHLRALVRKGVIADCRRAGSRGEIRIRRCDLPKKAGLASRLSDSDLDFASRVAANRKVAIHG